jgi:curli biogenesis system outer membrane secretion channel CsgG
MISFLSRLAPLRAPGLVSAGALLLLAGCASAPAVVTSSGTPDVAPAAPQAVDNVPRVPIAVSAFDYRLKQRGDIGQGIADLLADALYGSGRFQPQAAVPGAQLLIGGSVVAFDPACAGGAQIIVFDNQACVTVNIRIVDAASGKVLKAATVDGTSAAGGGGPALARGKLPISLQAYSKLPMEQAIRNCVEKAANLVAALSPQ